MIEQQIEIAATAGGMPTFMCRPEREAPWPVVVFYMDAPGIREELRDMARRLATAGYCVLLPDLYYRTRDYVPVDTTKAHLDGPDRARMLAMLKTLSIERVLDDTQAILAAIDQLPDVRRDRLGCVGYCMSGPFVFAAASRFASRFQATAAIYGTDLITDRPDSPHLLAGGIAGEIYFACGEKDRHTPPALVTKLRETLTSAGATHEVEVYPDADHAFAFPLRASYHKPSAERHWERLFSLYRRRLHG